MRAVQVSIGFGIAVFFDIFRFRPFQPCLECFLGRRSAGACSLAV